MDLTTPNTLAPEVFRAQQAASIPEICYMICEFMGDSHIPPLEDAITEEKVNHKALAGLARTSRDFFYSAVPTLWGGRETYTYEILTLLPGVIKRRINISPSSYRIRMVMSRSYRIQ